MDDDTSVDQKQIDNGIEKEQLGGDIHSINIEEIHAEVQANYEQGKKQLAQAEIDYIGAKSALELELAKREANYMSVEGGNMSKSRAEKQAMADTIKLRHDKDLAEGIYRAYYHACKALEHRRWVG